MGFVRKTPSGTYRACWRDLAGKQRSKSFPTKREASRFLAEIESAKNRGFYVDPHAGRIKLREYIATWLSGQNVERTTLAAILWLAVRDRLIAYNPCDGVQLPPLRRSDGDGRTISREAFAQKLLPAVPPRYYALVALAGGTGLRWGECVGLRWDAVDMDNAEVHVVRVAIEVAGTVTVKPFPKFRAGRRTVPLPPFVVQALRDHRARYGDGPAGEVFTNEAGGPVRRTLFRARVWRPALVRAGLLGKVVQEGREQYKATWRDSAGRKHGTAFATEREAVAETVRQAAGWPALP